MKTIAATLLSLLFLHGAASAHILRQPWGETPGHQKVELYTLDNGVLTVRIATYGGMLVDILAPDRNGRKANIIRGMDRLQDYFDRHVGLYGSIVGRYGNRIKGGQFTLDGKTYRLPVNNLGNTLHGGPIGFDQRVWKAIPHDGAKPRLTLTYTSLDGEMNFPGTLKTAVTYTLAGKDLRVDIRATTDKPTVLDLFVHPWFNLRGAGNGNILDQRLQIFADKYVEMDRSHAPTGELAPVAGTPFDFRKPIPIGTHIHDLDWQISGDPKAPGYDEQFAIDGPAGTLRHAARIEVRWGGRAAVCHDNGVPGLGERTRQVEHVVGQTADGQRFDEQHQLHAGTCARTATPTAGDAGPLSPSDSTSTSSKCMFCSSSMSTAANTA